MPTFYIETLGKTFTRTAAKPAEVFGLLGNLGFVPADHWTANEHNTYEISELHADFIRVNLPHGQFLCAESIDTPEEDRVLSHHYPTQEKRSFPEEKPGEERQDEQTPITDKDILPLHLPAAA